VFCDKRYDIGKEMERGYWVGLDGWSRK